MNTDEIYHILRTRLFDKLPSKDDIKAVVQSYADAVRDARHMDITSASPEKFAAQLAESYPFHFAIRDLYARFRENPGFQQTRGLIRLMRVLVARLYDEKHGRAGETSLISAHDLDLNDRDTLNEVTLINPSLENAISHDIASGGQAIAEIMDSKLGSTDAQDACKLILVSSLANIPNALLGLTESEVVSYLCSPGRDLSKLRKDVLGVLYSTAWYLHANREGKLYFKNLQNLVAKLKTTAESYNRESSRKELRKFLEDIFNPTIRDCYQQVVAMPPMDELDIKSDRVTMVICDPYPGGGLAPDLMKFYEDLTFKNRILFLSGQRDTMEALVSTAAELKAIGHILAEMESERVPDNDPQKVAAQELRERIQLRLLSAARESFTALTYPTADRLVTADFTMNFTDNEYNGEKQVRDVLKTKQKFTDEITGDTFRKKCEQRLFTTKTMVWTEVKKRAATNPGWQWHRLDALDALKEDLVHRDQWRQNFDYIEKGPFPEPDTEVRVQEITRNDETGEVHLRLTPANGDTIHYEIGSNVTEASAPVSDPREFRTAELILSFLCVDSKKKHKTGNPVIWKNRITMQSRIFQKNGNRMVEVRSAPPAPIRYTTDGSDPKNGGIYDDPFVLPDGTLFVLAIAEKNGIISDPHKIEIHWDKKDGFTIDAAKPAVWNREHRPDTTKDAYEFMELLKKHGASVAGPRIAIIGSNHWVELTCDDRTVFNADQLTASVNHIRGLLADGQVTIQTPALHFPMGQNLLDWLNDTRMEAKAHEVQQ
jgi:hypothetical protein